MDQAIFILGYVYLGLLFLIIILDVILFNREKGLKKRLEKKARKFYEEAIKYRPSRLTNDKDRIRYLKGFCGALSTKSSLSAFNLMLKNWMKYDKKDCTSYLHELGPVFALLSTIYERKPKLSKGYFAYLLSAYPIDISGKGNEETYEFLLGLSLDKSLYTRENALRALVRSGHSELVVEALAISKKENHPLNARLISEVLSNFPKGQEDAFILLLLNNITTFSTPSQVGIVNYMRMTSPNFKHASFLILNYAPFDKEVRYGALRYLKKNPLPMAKSKILAMGNEAIEKKDYEMEAVVASTISSYPSMDTGVYLLKAICSPFYLGRRNAADSLILIYGEKAQAMVSRLDDKFASNMINYRLENQEIENADMEDSD